MIAIFFLLAMLNIFSHRHLAQAFLFKGASAVTRRSTTLAAAGSFYDIVEKDAAGKDIAFSKFKGKVVYGVNVASKCGYVSKTCKCFVFHIPHSIVHITLFRW